MKRGFTVIELFVVVAVMGMLAATLFPVCMQAREKARRTKCIDNLRQIALATQIWAQENDEKLPTSQSFWTSIDVPAKVKMCPTKKALPNGYVFTDVWSGLALDKLPIPENCIILADGEKRSNGAYANVAYEDDKDYDLRHDKGYGVACADGHVELLEEIAGPMLPLVVPGTIGAFEVNRQFAPATTLRNAVENTDETARYKAPRYESFCLGKKGTGLIAHNKSDAEFGHHATVETDGNSWYLCDTFYPRPTSTGQSMIFVGSTTEANTVMLGSDYTAREDVLSLVNGRIRSTWAKPGDARHQQILNQSPAIRTTYNDGVPHVFLYNYRLPSGTVAVWVDGKKVAEKSSTGTRHTPKHMWVMGSAPDEALAGTPAVPFVGKCAEIMISNTGLSTSQIIEITRYLKYKYRLSFNL